MFRNSCDSSLLNRMRDMSLVNSVTASILLKDKNCEIQVCHLWRILSVYPSQGSLRFSHCICRLRQVLSGCSPDKRGTRQGDRCDKKIRKLERNFLTCAAAAPLRSEDELWMAKNLGVPYKLYQASNLTSQYHHPNTAKEAMVYLKFISEHYDCLPEVGFYFQIIHCLKGNQNSADIKAEKNRNLLANSLSKEECSVQWKWLI